MSRRGKPQPGVAARFPSLCRRCKGDVAVGDRVVFSRGRAIHVECASGADDE